VRTLLRLLCAACIAFVLTMAGVIGHALWTGRAAAPEPADLIIVLGGTMNGDNSLASETRGRVREGVRLHEAGLAPRIHFTGGSPDKGRPGAGDQMMALAIEWGVPPAAASAENWSESTLQNALFSREILGVEADGSVILVSDGYHLARAWLTFRWAGYGPIALDAASPFGDQSIARRLRRVGRESLAWWYNLARVAVWEVLEAVDGHDPARMEMLR